MDEDIRHAFVKACKSLNTKEFWAIQRYFATLFEEAKENEA